MTQFKVLVVDDEWLVRSELKTMLAEFPSVQVVAEASNVPQAVECIRRENPDVIFLDIQMPGETGFDLLERVDIKAKIVFITAFDQYAIRAFEVNAVDYLLKPINKNRLRQTLQRLGSDAPSEGKPGKVLYGDALYLTVNGSLKFVKVSEVKAVVAEGNYSFILTADRKKDLVTKTLQEWEDILPDKVFIRIHRSTIVNFEYVDKVRKCRNYTQMVYLKDVAEPFIMSRRYALKLKQRMPW
jgi:two-component system LytT family response regulator